MASTGAIIAGSAYVKLALDSAEMNKGLKEAQGKLKNFIASINEWGNSMAAVSVTAFQPFLKAVNTFSDFDLQMRKVRAITGATGKEFETLTRHAREYGRATSYTTSEVANAMVNLARMGFSADEVKKSTRHVMNLARATGETLADSAQVAANQMRIFGLSASNMGDISDVIVTTVNKSSQTLQDYAEGASKAGPNFQHTGQDIREMSASLGVLANMGIRGSLAGTALSRAIKRFADPRVQAILNQYGISVKQLDGNMRPLHETLVDISKVMAAMPSDVRIHFAEEIFEVRGALAGLPLTVNAKGIEDLLNALRNCKDVAAATANEMEAGMYGAIKRFESAWNDVAIQIGGLSASAFQPTLDSFSNLINHITDISTGLNSLIKVLLKAGVAVMALGTGVFVFDKLAVALKTIWQPIGILEEKLTGVKKKADDLAAIRQYKAMSSVADEAEKLASAKMAEYKVAQKAADEAQEKALQERNTAQELSKQIDVQKQAINNSEILIQKEKLRQGEIAQTARIQANMTEGILRQVSEQRKSSFNAAQSAQIAMKNIAPELKRAKKQLQTLQRKADDNSVYLAGKNKNSENYGQRDRVAEAKELATLIKSQEDKVAKLQAKYDESSNLYKDLNKQYQQDNTVYNKTYSAFIAQKNNADAADEAAKIFATNEKIKQAEIANTTIQLKQEEEQQRKIATEAEKTAVVAKRQAEQLKVEAERMKKAATDSRMSAEDAKPDSLKNVKQSEQEVKNYTRLLEEQAKARGLVNQAQKTYEQKMYFAHGGTDNDELNRLAQEQSEVTEATVKKTDAIHELVTRKMIQRETLKYNQMLQQLGEYRTKYQAEMDAIAIETSKANQLKKAFNRGEANYKYIPIEESVNGEIAQRQANIQKLTEENVAIQKKVDVLKAERKQIIANKQAGWYEKSQPLLKEERKYSANVASNVSQIRQEQQAVNALQQQLNELNAARLQERQGVDNMFVQIKMRREQLSALNDEIHSIEQSLNAINSAPVINTRPAQIYQTQQNNYVAQKEQLNAQRSKLMQERSELGGLEGELSALEYKAEKSKSTKLKAKIAEIRQEITVRNERIAVMQQELLVTKRQLESSGTGRDFSRTKEQAKQNFEAFKASEQLIYAQNNLSKSTANLNSVQKVAQTQNARFAQHFVNLGRKTLWCATIDKTYNIALRNMSIQAYATARSLAYLGTTGVKASLVRKTGYYAEATAAKSAAIATNLLGKALNFVARNPVMIVMMATMAIKNFRDGYLERQLNSAKDAANEIENIANRVAQKNSDVQEKLTTDWGYVQKLKELEDKGVELSTDEQATVNNVIAILSSKYGDMGISIDKNTHVLTGVNANIKKITEKMRTVGMASDAEALTSRAKQINEHVKYTIKALEHATSSSLAGKATDIVGSGFGGTAKFITTGNTVSALFTQMTGLFNQYGLQLTKESLDNGEFEKGLLRLTGNQLDEILKVVSKLEDFAIKNRTNLGEEATQTISHLRELFAAEVQSRKDSNALWYGDEPFKQQEAGLKLDEIQTPSEDEIKSATKALADAEEKQTLQMMSNSRQKIEALEKEREAYLENLAVLKKEARARYAQAQANQDYQMMNKYQQTFNDLRKKEEAFNNKINTQIGQIADKTYEDVFNKFNFINKIENDVKIANEEKSRNKAVDNLVNNSQIDEAIIFLRKWFYESSLQVDIAKQNYKQALDRFAKIQNENDEDDFTDEQKDFLQTLQSYLQEAVNKRESVRDKLQGVMDTTRGANNNISGFSGKMMTRMFGQNYSQSLNYDQQQVYYLKRINENTRKLELQKTETAD